MQGKYNFIKLQKIILRNFSLYKKDGTTYEVNEEINNGVYCLAGANGLGKTTFLNSINYGLTGIVLDPNREMFAPNEIVFENKKYTERYFKGRITANDEIYAEIEITFKINEIYFRIIRGFFEREGLRLLEIFSFENDRKISHFISKNESPKELNVLYQKKLTTETGFSGFDYFIFYQLYVLTFDENRRMIFWDERASASALAVAFNNDPNDAERILDVKRKMEKHESNGKNARWQATQANNKIKELQAKIPEKKENIDQLELEFNRIYKEAEKAQNVFNNIGIEYDTILKKQSYVNSEILKFKNEHTRLFSRYSKPRSKLIENTNVLHSIQKQECCICSAQGNFVVENIERSIHNEKCPLCYTPIMETDNVEQEGILKLIQENDRVLSEKNKELENLTFEIDNKKIELEKAEIDSEKLKVKIKDFTDENSDISFSTIGNIGIDSLIEQYKNQFSLSDNEAKNEYLKRDKLRPDYEKLLKRVEASYKSAETVFVPIFKKLAKSFIGLDLNIQPNRSNKGIKLILELKDTARTESFQLSESQRFFLDIALRMSLAIFLSNNQKGATMFVDTPEGSLDIAYESRVGTMFAEFATIYNQNLFMTANINASQLLISLAEKCGKNKMQFRRMLEWTDLSEIQKEGETLFKKVYSNIEIALNKKINE